MKLHAPDKKKLYVHSSKIAFRDVTLTGPDREHACPYVGCEFSSLQKSNLKTHLNTQ